MLAHSHLRDINTMLIHQPPPDPLRGMPLLPRLKLIGDQPLIDQRPKLAQLRRRPTLRPLARRRDRRGQRLAHRPTTDPIARRQRPLRQILTIVIPA
jgi:hypothetical protein